MADKPAITVSLEKTISLALADVVDEMRKAHGVLVKTVVFNWDGPFLMSVESTLLTQRNAP